MSYDHSSESQGLELPNPDKLQNRVLLFCALVLAGVGLALLASAIWATARFFSAFGTAAP